MKQHMIRLLCVLMALMLPLCAMAETAEAPVKETVVTLSLIPGEEMAEEPAVKDLAEAMQLRLAANGSDAVAMDVLLNGESMMNAVLRMDDSGLYVLSNMIGAEPAYMDWQSLLNGYLSLLKESGAPDEMIAQYEQLYSGMLSGAPIAEMFPQGDNPVSFKDLSKEEFAAQMETILGDKEYAEWVANFYTRMKMTDGEFTSKDHDKASVQYTVTITGEDIADLYRTDYFRNMIKDEIAASEPELSAEELEETFNEGMDELMKALDQLEIQMPMTMLMADDALVSMTMPMTMKGEVTNDDGSAPTKIDILMDIAYNRLTDEEGVHHRAKMNFSGMDEDPMSMVGELTYLANQGWNGSFTAKHDEEIFVIRTQGTITEGAVNGLMGIETEGSEMLIQLDKTKTDDITDCLVSLYFHDDVKEPMVLSEDEKPLFSIKANIVSAENSGIFDGIATLSPESSKQPFQMDQAGLQSYVLEVQSAAMGALYNTLSQLPESVLALISESMQPTTEPIE